MEQVGKYPGWLEQSQRATRVVDHGPICATEENCRAHGVFGDDTRPVLIHWFCPQWVTKALSDGGCCHRKPMEQFPGFFDQCLLPQSGRQAIQNFATLVLEEATTRVQC